MMPPGAPRQATNQPASFKGKGKVQEPPQLGTQILVTRPAPSGTVVPGIRSSTKRSHKITTQQSQEIVQTFLFSAISTILWMRDLLPPEYFRTMYYSSINKHCSYYDFTHADNDPSAVLGERPHKGYHLSILRRDASKRGDQIINWLETGIFDAINRGYVNQLQISIFADAEQPTRILELYCFCFQYRESPEDGSMTVDMEIEDTRDQSRVVTLQNAREALNTVVRNMVALNGSMPCLPERRYMTPYLVWGTRRPSGYQPPGFCPSGDENISLPITSGWEMETSICGSLNTGVQTVNLSVLYTKETAPIPDDNGEAVVMPQILTYGEPFSRLGPFRSESGLLRNQKLNASQIIRNPECPNLPFGTSAIDHSPVSTSTTETNRTGTSLKDGSTFRQLDESTHRKLQSRDREELNRLMALQRPLEPPQVQDTQPIHHSSEAPIPIKFTATIRQELSRRRKNNHTMASTLQHNSSGSATVSCECGTSAIENIIQCHFCEGSQHVHCYGYESIDDFRIPEDHACYTCLLGDKEDQHLVEASYLCRVRQVICKLQAQNFESPTQLANSLGYKRADVMTPLQDLQREDLITVTKPSKKSKAGDKLELNRSAAAQDKLMQTYFDPSRGIENLIDTYSKRGGGLDDARRVTVSTPGPKRKARGYHDGGHQPKTPRYSRPLLSIEFNEADPYTPGYEDLDSSKSLD